MDDAQSGASDLERNVVAVFAPSHRADFAAVERVTVRQFSLKLALQPRALVAADLPPSRHEQRVTLPLAPRRGRRDGCEDRRGARGPDVVGGSVARSWRLAA
jgi:hypothetical protein